MDIMQILKYVLICLVAALFLILFLISSAMWYFNLYVSAQDKAHKTIEHKTIEHKDE